MKNIVLTFLIAAIAFILLPQAVNCQWYAKKYGVETLNDLSEAQVKDVFLKAGRNIQIGRSMVLVGAGLEVAGGVLYLIGRSKLNEDVFNWFHSGWEEMALGVLIMGAGAIPLGIGIPLWAVNHKRRTAVENIHGQAVQQISLHFNITRLQGERYYGAAITIPLAGR